MYLDHDKLIPVAYIVILIFPDFREVELFVAETIGAVVFTLNV